MSSSPNPSFVFLPFFYDTSNAHNTQVKRFKPSIVYQHRPLELLPSTPVFPFAPLRRPFKVSGSLNRYRFPSLKTGTSTFPLKLLPFTPVFPTNYSEAVKEKCWNQAIQEELCALKANKT